jgi:hypothetical protein
VALACGSIPSEAVWRMAGSGLSICLLWLSILQV